MRCLFSVATVATPPPLSWRLFQLFSVPTGMPKVAATCAGACPASSAASAWALMCSLYSATLHLQHGRPGRHHQEHDAGKDEEARDACSSIHNAPTTR